MDQNWIEEQLKELPLYQYAFIKTGELLFSDRIRWVCEHECPMYNRRWTCPPAVGGLQDCKKRCLKYSDALLIATIVEVEDAENMEEALSTQPAHEHITRKVHEIIKSQAVDTMVLSTGSCACCKDCSWPDEKCRFPEQLYACVESHGIVVTDLGEKAGIDFYLSNKLITWFSLIFFR